MSQFKKLVTSSEQVFIAGVAWSQKRDVNVYHGVFYGYEHGKFFFNYECQGLLGEFHSSWDLPAYLYSVVSFFEDCYKVIDNSKKPVIYVPNAKLAKLFNKPSIFKKYRLSPYAKNHLVLWNSLLKTEFKSFNNEKFPFSQISLRATEIKSLTEYRMINGEKFDFKSY